MSDPSATSRQSSVVRLDIADDTMLYDAYMPFVVNGGLFVARHFLADSGHDLGDDLFVLLHLLAHDERLSVAGRVVWVSPPAMQRPEGIGVQFAAHDSGATQQRIEALLAGRTYPNRPTHTL